jgi:predicted MPP superfamily phosphohydrolase
MSFFIIILIGIPALSIAWWIWADRRFRRLKAPRSLRLLMGLALCLMLASYCWVVLSRREIVSEPIPAGLYAVVLLWGLIFLPMLGLPMMTSWALWSTGRYLNRMIRKIPSPIDDEASTMAKIMSRRELLGTAAVALPVIATFGTAGISLPQTQRFRVREISIALKNLPESLDGMRIAHITDTHVGKFTTGKMLDEIADATNRLNPDLIFLTGDLIDNSIKDLPAALAMVQRMNPRSGLFMIEGNHDLIDDPAAFARDVQASGINFLKNQSAMVQVRGQDIQILGIAWDRNESRMHDDVATVAKLRQPSAFPILLAHHPHAFDAATQHDIPLTLAGHTHGGQLMLTPTLGAGPAMYRYWSGLYQTETGALVVSNGAGNWFPLRTAAPAEIVHITLHRDTPPRG